MGFRTVVSVVWKTAACAQKLTHCTPSFAPIVWPGHILLDPETPPPASADTAAVQERENIGPSLVFIVHGVQESGECVVEGRTQWSCDLKLPQLAKL